MLSPGVYCDWRTNWYAVSNWQRMWSGVESGSLCMTLTDQILGKGSGGIVSEWQLVGMDSILWWCTGVHLYGLKGDGGFLQCKRHYT